jgi:exodeoxyribonuclease VII small subunit
VTRQAKKSSLAAETPSAEAPSSFEHTLHRLGEIVERLEGGDLPLEDSLRLFEEGIRLASSSQAILEGAERRVEELLSFTEAGQPVVKDIDSRAAARGLATDDD